MAAAAAATFLRSFSTTNPPSPPIAHCFLDRRRLCHCGTARLPATTTTTSDLSAP